MKLENHLILLFIAEKYQDLKGNLQTALQKRDPDQIATVLKAIEKRIPPENISEKDKEMFAKAQEQIEKIESGKGILENLRYAIRFTLRIKEMNSLEIFANGQFFNECDRVGFLRKL